MRTLIPGIGLGLAVALHSCGANAFAQNLLANGGFEFGRGDWKCAGDVSIGGAVTRHGQGALRIRSGGGAQQDLPELPVGAQYTVSVAIRLSDVHPTAQVGYAYAAVYQLDDFDDIVSAHDFVQQSGSADWAQHSYTFTVGEHCRTVSLRVGLFQATGTLWVDDVALVPGSRPAGLAALEHARSVTLARLGLPLTQGGPGNIAILQDNLPTTAGSAPPAHLAQVLKQAGFGVAFLDAGQLADPAYLDRAFFDAVILPYGPAFPVRAADSFRRFLRQGGKFLSTGGYAFDNLLERTPEGWMPPRPAQPSAPDHALWHLTSPAAELRGKGQLTFSGHLKTARIRGPGMAYFAIYQTAADGSLLTWRDLCQVRGSHDWQETRHTFDVDPRAAAVDFRAGLYRCHGLACFDDVRLVDAAGEVLFESGFEEPISPDQEGLRQWLRSDARLCDVGTRTRRSGQRSLTVRLEYDLLAEERLNTRHGVPEDDLRVQPTQLGVFDADYRLERVRSAHAAPGQCVLPGDLGFAGPLEGYAASGVAGFDAARWVPLLNASDGYGRLRGAAGALLRHYAGTYAGSSWAFFGVTNRDLFAQSAPGMDRALVSLMHNLVSDTYVASLVPQTACLRQGEQVTLVATLFNGGRQAATRGLTVEILAGEPGVSHTAAHRATFRFSTNCTLEAGQTNVSVFHWAPPRFEADFYHVIGRLWHATQEVDRIESGFLVSDPRVVAAGPRLQYQDNYLQYGRRPLFLFGTDDWSYVFTTARETPLQWLADMRQRRDFGVLIYENLQFGIPPSSGNSERLLRKVDGIAQLAQKHQQVYFPGLLVGYNVAASDAELARQKEFCRAFAARYAGVPALIHYLNGDLRCRLGPDVAGCWNDFLRERYGSTEKLRAAWGPRAPPQELGRVPVEDFNDWGHAWDDVRVYDLNCFRAWLIRRWTRALIAGIRESDRLHPTTAEFYQLPHEGVDLPAGIDGMDLANFGYFDRPDADLARFPAICKYNDQRARGKSVGPGEYGVKTHPAWGDGNDYNYHIARTRDQAIELFLAIPHYSLGLGASRIHNWCWKDDAHRVFPWGLVYPCDNVPKDILYVHRNQSLLFRHFAPHYTEPSVYVLTADAHRFGGGKWRVIEGILQGIGLALAAHVENLGTLNEFGLELPRSARVIYYPLPYCPSDEAYAKIRDWVRQGGVLYLSGDISYDESRRRTRMQRLEELCGVRFLTERYPNIAVPPASTNTSNATAQDWPCIGVEPASPAAAVLQRAADGLPLVVEHRLGKGRVIYSTDPIELHNTTERRRRNLELYGRVLETAGVRPIGLAPADPLTHAFRLPLRDGGQVYVLFNTDTRQPSRSVTLTDLEPPVSVSVARRRPALLWFDGHRSLRAVETQGELVIGPKTVLSDETHGILLSLDQRDLRDSQALVLMPLNAGTVRISRTTPWPRAQLETGEFHNGHWQTFASSTVPGMGPGTGRELRISIAPDQVFSLLLVCDPDSAPRWRRALERAMTDPGSLP